MFLALTWQAWLTLAVLVVMFAILIFTETEPALVFGGGMAVFCLSGVLSPAEAFSGFSDTAVVCVIVLYIVIAGMTYTHVLEWIVSHLMGTPKTLTGAIVRLMAPVAVLSAFLNNTAVVALFVDVVKKWAGKLGIAPSKLLIPLSYASGMGGICTLIGTAPNIIISGMFVSDHPGTYMGIFAPLGVGLICLVVGVLSMLAMQRLLPVRKSLDDPTADDDIRNQRNGAWRLKHVQRSRGLIRAQLSHYRHPATVETDDANQPDYGRKTLLSAVIMLAMVLLSALKVMTLLNAAILAALLMMIFRCCNAKQALNAINWNIIMVFAGSVVLGKALQNTGLAQQIANMLLGVCGPHPIVVLCAMTLAATFITEFISNTACGAMFYPIAMAAADSLGANPMTFAIALMVAVSSSFATPIGSPTHMLVYQPGGYRFGDFVRVGVPMNLIIWGANIGACLLLFGI